MHYPLPGRGTTWCSWNHRHCYCKEQIRWGAHSLTKYWIASPEKDQVVRWWNWVNRIVQEPPKKHLNCELIGNYLPVIAVDCRQPHGWFHVNVCSWLDWKCNKSQTHPLFTTFKGSINWPNLCSLHKEGLVTIGLKENQMASGSRVAENFRVFQQILTPLIEPLKRKSNGSIQSLWKFHLQVEVFGGSIFHSQFLLHSHFQYKLTVLCSFLHPQIWKVRFVCISRPSRIGCEKVLCGLPYSSPMTYVRFRESKKYQAFRSQGVPNSTLVESNPDTDPGSARNLWNQKFDKSQKQVSERLKPTVYVWHCPLSKKFRHVDRIR